MSYILDALRKSETERRQGKVPDLGHQIQLIHRPKKKRLSAVAWVAIALVLNAGVLAAVFWPKIVPVSAEAGAPAERPIHEEVRAQLAPMQPAKTVGSEIETEPDSLMDEPAGVERASRPQSEPQPRAEEEVALAESGGTVVEEVVRQRPTIITPSSPVDRENSVLPEEAPAGRVPHLVELPLSFQKSVPDLTFNSHIYASDPYASRVMINSHYLRRGDSFSGLRVDRITEDGVILSKDGQRFRVGTVRDWVSPR